MLMPQRAGCQVWLGEACSVAQIEWCDFLLASGSTTFVWLAVLVA
jgi:hypothetical protein